MTSSIRFDHHVTDYEYFCRQEFHSCFKAVLCLLYFQTSMNVILEVMIVVHKIPNVVTISDHSVVNVLMGILKIWMVIVLVRKFNQHECVEPH